jgi:hypothetical protein
VSTVTEHRKRASRATAADGPEQPSAEAIETPHACTRCGQDFVAGEWFCADGERHTVAERTYLLNDAPMQSGYSPSGPLPKHGRTIITNIPPPDLTNWQPGAYDEHLGGSVTFIDGRYTTSDPVEQHYLDLRGGYCTESEWEVSWLSPEELKLRRHERVERELAAREKELAALRQELEGSN